MSAMNEAQAATRLAGEQAAEQRFRLLTSTRRTDTLMWQIDGFTDIMHSLKAFMGPTVDDLYPIALQQDVWYLIRRALILSSTAGVVSPKIYEIPPTDYNWDIPFSLSVKPYQVFEAFKNMVNGSLSKFDLPFRPDSAIKELAMSNMMSWNVQRQIKHLFWYQYDDIGMQIQDWHALNRFLKFQKLDYDGPGTIWDADGDGIMHSPDAQIETFTLVILAVPQSIAKPLLGAPEPDLSAIRATEQAATRQKVFGDAQIKALTMDLKRAEARRDLMAAIHVNPPRLDRIPDLVKACKKFPKTAYFTKESIRRLDTVAMCPDLKDGL